MKAFLDYERPAPSGWLLARWPDEVINLLDSGAVTDLSLDHDLGDDERGNGYDVLLWIEEAVATRAFMPPRIYVHSANSAARQRMEAAIRSIGRLASEDGRRAVQPIDVCWDTDIGRDPDDFLAGCFLLSRPELRLRAITISPGDRDQIALAKFLLQTTGHADVPVGAVPEREKQGKTSVKGCQLLIMERHGVPTSTAADGAGWEVIQEAFRTCPQAALFTSGPLNNVGDLLRKTDIEIGLSVSMAGYWAAQGEPETKPEFNFNGCGWAAMEFTESGRFRRRLLVGKNVTHQVLYDDGIHEQLSVAGQISRPLALAHELMSLRSERSKKLHDPLAATALLREDIFDWQEVRPFKRGGQWGSSPQSGTGIWIATAANVAAFRSVLTGHDAS